jgi:hypothetical protein
MIFIMCNYSFIALNHLILFEACLGKKNMYAILVSVELGPITFCTY